jgi:hypothetical protein
MIKLTDQAIFLDIALNDVHSQVLFMDQSCKGMSTKLAAVKTRTHQLMSQMTSFQTARLVQ